MQAIGEKARKPMSKAIQYTDEQLGDINLVTDFLPSPKELAIKNKQTKITISLSSDSVEFFKEIAEKIFVSSDTVKFHRKKLFEKLNVANISEAITYVTNNKLI